MLQSAQITNQHLRGDSLLTLPRSHLFHRYMEYQKKLFIEKSADLTPRSKETGFLKNKLLGELLDLQTKRTLRYHFPREVQEHLEALTDLVPANPSRLLFPSTHLWIQFDHPFPLGNRNFQISAVHFSKIHDPANIPVIHEVYKRNPPIDEQSAQHIFASQLGKWVLTFIAFQDREDGEQFSTEALGFDASQATWAYLLTHDCSSCTLKKGEDGKPIEWVECDHCRMIRLTRCTWFATAVSMLWGEYDEWGPLVPLTAHLPRHVRAGTNHTLTTVQIDPISTNTQLQGKKEQSQLEIRRPSDDTPFMAGCSRHNRSNQVWISHNMERLEWISSHSFQECAQRMVSLIQTYHVFLQHSSRWSLFLDLLTNDSDGVPKKPSAQVEASILDNCRVAAQRPRFERTLLSFQTVSRSILPPFGEKNGRFDVHDYFSSPSAEEVTLLSRCFAAQTRLNMDRTSIVFAAPSALAMTEAMLTEQVTPLNLPESPIWIQPLASCWYRGQLVRAIYLSPLLNEHVLLKELAPLHLPASAQEKIQRDAARFSEMWQVEFIVDPNFTIDRIRPPHPNPGMDLISAFALYSPTNQWLSSLRAIRECPTKQCTYEHLGDQKIPLMCTTCQAELHYWPRWIATMLSVAAGEFRRDDDLAPFESLSLSLPDTAAPNQQNKKGNKPRTYHVTIVQYDASYFRIASTSLESKGTLQKTQQGLSSEEAIAQGILEVDPNVLIPDWNSVRGYWRRRPYHPTQKQYIGPKDRRIQYITLATWKARQEGMAHRAREIVANPHTGNF